MALHKYCKTIAVSVHYIALFVQSNFVLLVQLMISRSCIFQARKVLEIKKMQKTQKKFKKCEQKFKMLKNGVWTPL